MKYSINMLGIIGAHVNEEINIDTYEKSFQVINYDLKLLDFLCNEGSVTYLTTSVVMDLIKFKW